MNELEKAFEFKIVIDKLIERISTFIPEAKNNLNIKNCILMAHNTLEGITNLLLSRYYLGQEIEKTNKDKVNNFWINLLVEISFKKKIQIIKEISILSNNSIKALLKINDIRNDIAHYPHRGYKRKNKHLMYNGKHIFKNPDAIGLFYDDFDRILKEARSIIQDSQV